MRIHLFGLFGSFFGLYYVFLTLYTRFVYISEIKYTVSLNYNSVFEARLDQSVQSLSAVVYSTDMLAVSSVLRLQDIYTRVKDELTVGYIQYGDFNLHNR